MSELHVQGGAFQVARKIFKSELWLMKPSSWKVIWIYILGRVNHEKDNINERGEGFFQWSKEYSQIGEDITENMIKKASIYFRKSGMVSTRRSTRGVRITVLNYDVYQTLDNYERTHQRTREELEKNLRRTTIDKNVKNEKNVKKYISVDTDEKKVHFETFWEAYPKKVGRKYAEKQWLKLHYEDQQNIIHDIPRRKNGRQWKEGFIPHPTTYLNGERWKDEIEIPSTLPDALILQA